MSHPDQTIIMLIILGYDVIFQGRIRVWWLNRRSVIPGERYPLAFPFIALAAALDNGLKKIKKIVKIPKTFKKKKVNVCQ